MRRQSRVIQTRWLRPQRRHLLARARQRLLRLWCLRRQSKPDPVVAVPSSAASPPLLFRRRYHRHNRSRLLLSRSPQGSVAPGRCHRNRNRHNRSRLLLLRSPQGSAAPGRCHRSCHRNRHRLNPATSLASSVRHLPIRHPFGLRLHLFRQRRLWCNRDDHRSSRRLSRPLLSVPRPNGNADDLIAPMAENRCQPYLPYLPPHHPQLAHPHPHPHP